MFIRLYSISLVLLLASCADNTISIKNEKKGKLKSSIELIANGEKKFYLDSETAPKSPYMQIFTNADGERMLTFLNPYKSAIYFYNYEDTTYIRKIVYEREGANAILRPAGYYIKSLDSIYVYNMPMTEVDLANSDGQVKKRISLRTDEPDWPDRYPQYLLKTVNPLILKDDKLLLTGQTFRSLPVSRIDDFKFAAYINIQTDEVRFCYIYPKEIYGSNSNWEGGLSTQVYPALSSKGEIIHSFPASHNLYLYKEGTNIPRKVYAGSNVATTIHSINYDEPRKTPDELCLSHYLQEDMYGAIIYDPYRKMYYRFLIRGIPNASIKTSIEEKLINIIIMDENFNYLGETTLGKGKEWNWANSFITQEGLNIEYIDAKDINEDYLILKTFIPANL